MDPGILESTETSNGKTIQRYSDGLIVEISEREISERDEHFEMSAIMPDDYGHVRNAPLVDDLINNLMSLASVHGHMPNSSREQALLRHFSDYYLNMNEPQKAEPLAEAYLKEQMVLGVQGAPLAYAQRTLGAAKVGLRNHKDAVPLLKSAAKYYKDSDDRKAYWQVLKNLGLALSETGQAEEASKCQAASNALAAKYHFSEVQSKPQEFSAKKTSPGIRPTGASITVRNFDSK
jgi:tetratricopeptide (TPR) repeat protein